MQRVIRPVRPQRAYLCVQSFRSLDDYLATCQRSVRQSLTTQTDKAMPAITVTSRPAAPLTWEHFVVIFAHERRTYNILRAFFASLMRFVRHVFAAVFCPLRLRSQCFFAAVDGRIAHECCPWYAAHGLFAHCENLLPAFFPLLFRQA